MAEGDAGFAEIVWRHFDVHLVANADADEVLSHLAGNMCEHLVPIGESHTKHRARKDLRHRACQFYWFFFSHANQLWVLFHAIAKSENQS